MPSPSIRAGERDGRPTQVLAAGPLEAEFCPAVGMVGCSLRQHGRELLGQRGGLAAYAERGSSFGLPLLHPWANRLSGFTYTAAGRTVELDAARTPLKLEEHGLPLHGLLTASPLWELVTADVAGGAARLVARLDFGAHPRLLAGFPFPHELRVEARLAPATLTVETTLRATGDVPVPVAFGWHPYLTLPGVPREQWELRLPVRSRALLDDQAIPTGATEPPPFTGGALGERALDDLYPELDTPAVFSVSGGGGSLSVRYEQGYPAAQVFSPAGAGFVCFEPMTAPTNALVTGGPALRTVEPGTTFAASFSLAVEGTPGV